MTPDSSDDRTEQAGGQTPDSSADRSADRPNRSWLFLLGVALLVAAIVLLAQRIGWWI